MPSCVLNDGLYYCGVGILAAGTSGGSVAMWSWLGDRGPSVEGADKWEYLTTAVLAGPVTQLQVQ